MGFLSLCNIGSKERHKSTTRNYVPCGSLCWLFEGMPCFFYVCCFSAIYLAMRLLREIAFLKGRDTRYKFPCLVVIGDTSA